MCSESKEKLYKEKLIRGVKKEVKQIMEEAVTKKFVHEDSASITSLCAAVELCVSHGLKRRALGLFKNSSTYALLHKVAKTFQPAASVAQMVVEIESCDPNKRSSSGSESASKLTLGGKPQLQKRASTVTNKFLWIRLALVEKQLAKIIDYIVQTSSKYYEKDALVADSDYGPILSSLLVGPCALDFSKLRTGEHIWTDPPADELVQRHRISSVHFPSSDTVPSLDRPALNYKRSSGFSDSHISKDYVESLHQNNKSTLLYGKNNVQVYQKGVEEPLTGYLSLHQCGEPLILKWTPNQLMNGSHELSSVEKSSYWDHALNLLVHELVYVHCHQDSESDWIVLVGQDGIQYPPIHFQRGGHLLAFLSVLENGLLPNGMLDPPLWSEKGEEYFPVFGKVFPKLRKKESASIDDTKASDFVFRIVTGNFNGTYPQDFLDNPLWKLSSTPQVVPSTPRSTPIHSLSTTSSTSSSKSLDQQPSIQNSGEPIQVVCRTMRKQIISRAFYGWLGHCRHMKTIRTHLTGLVQRDILQSDQIPESANEGVTEAWWKEFLSSETQDMKDLCKLVYLGGITHSLRTIIWPFLLKGNLEKDDPEAIRQGYENLMSQWSAVEVIVRQRDKETNLANLVKLSSGGHEVTPHCDVSQNFHDSNEVFEDSIVPDGGAKNEKKIIENNINGIPNGPVIEDLKENGQGDDVNRNEKNREGITENNVGSSDEDERLPTSLDGEYTNELLETFGLNLHRIDKDVKRCDRNHTYFTETNLEKLRNIMCTFVWEHIDLGYVQGMCDLAAPLLVIMDDEAKAYTCFRNLMNRMSANFPSCGCAMDANFANMRSLLQALDHDLFTLIRQNGDYSHFYFCYRWFLLDFKREFCYEDVFRVWETIWAAQSVASKDFVLFIALALLSYYRDIILTNGMDFTDIIKFFNEMAEHHDAKIIIEMARNFVCQLQSLLEN